MEPMGWKLSWINGISDWMSPKSFEAGDHFAEREESSRYCWQAPVMSQLETPTASTPDFFFIWLMTESLREISANNYATDVVHYDGTENHPSEIFQNHEQNP